MVDDVPLLVAGEAAADDDVPLLVRVRAGNPVTGAAILSCLNTADTRALRQLHAAAAGAVAAVPWADMDTPVVDVVHWRAALPAAVGARLTEAAVAGLLSSFTAVEVLTGITRLDLRRCSNVTDVLLLLLPPTLCTLNVCDCSHLTECASFAHLTSLTSLDYSGAGVSARVAPAGLPPSLEELDATPAGESLAHLCRLRVLRAAASSLGADMLASLQPGLVELDVSWCGSLTEAVAASFAHLRALHTLRATSSGLDDATLATLPPALVYLNVKMCENLTPAAELPPLPALRVLDVSATRVGDALVASLPSGLEELRITQCRNVTAGATLDHVPALWALYSMGTALAPAVVASCRAHGCAAPAAGELRGHGNYVTALAVLADGRLAIGDQSREVRLWNLMTGSGAVIVLQTSGWTRALAALSDGRRLAVSVDTEGEGGCVEVWDVTATPPVRAASIRCDSAVSALAALVDGRLAAGCDNGSLQIVDVDAGDGVAVLDVLRHQVTALAVLPNGELAVGSGHGAVHVWDVGTQVCVAVLGGHTGWVRLLAVLADGRLAWGAGTGVVALWDVGARTRVSTLDGHSNEVVALAALPDGRLVSESVDGGVLLWDSRPAAAAAMAATSHAAGTVPMTVLARVPYVGAALVPLPDGRLACDHESVVFLLEVPPPATYE